MREIAYTTFGRNALFAGLISHVAALIVAMMSGAGAYGFFSVVYPLYWSAFILGVYIELKNRGCRPFENWRFYIIAVAAVLPIIGPLTGLFMLYALQGDKNVEQFKLWGMFSSVFRLKASLLVIFLIITILFVLFALTQQQNDPYFKKVRQKKVLLNNQQKEFSLCKNNIFA